MTQSQYASVIFLQKSIKKQADNQDSGLNLTMSKLSTKLRPS